MNTRILHTYDAQCDKCKGVCKHDVSKPQPTANVEPTPVRELKVVKNTNGLLLKFADGGMNTIADFRDYPGIEEHAENIVRAVNSHEGLLNVLTWLSNEIDENGQGNLPDGLVSAVTRAIAKAEGK